MTMRLLAICTIALSTYSGLPCRAQAYHQNYGGARVVKQNQIGLFHKDASYISCATLGQSARDGGVHSAGIQTGALPTTHWGGYIRNPGDDIYNGSNGAMRQSNGSMVYGDEVAYANQQMKMREQEQRMQLFMMQMQQQQRSNRISNSRGHYYVPGDNGACNNYGSGVACYSKYSN